MYIHQAVSEAMGRRCCIARRSWKFSIRVRPTNNNTLKCTYIDSDTGRTTGRWAPSADDLIAEDWQLVQ